VKEIARYRDLFINRENAYAKVLVDHLKGRTTCGWYCLNKDNQIKWACGTPIPWPYTNTPRVCDGAWTVASD
jgi:hypothetical protein